MAYCRCRGDIGQEMRRLEAENARLKRELERAGHIIAAQKKLARLLEEEQS